MRYLTNRNRSLSIRIGAICVLASAPMLSGCIATQGDRPATANEEAALVAEGVLALNAAGAAEERAEIAAEERKRRAERRRLREYISESNCYIEPRKRRAATAAMERMLDGVGGEYYTEGGHGGGC